MSRLAHIADRVLNRPLLITPDKLAVIAQVLAGRIGLDAAIPAETPPEAALAPQPEASRFVGEWAEERDASGAVIRVKPYRMTADGVALLHIIGSLVNRGAWVGASSGLTSYEGLKFQFEKLAADQSVKAVILDMQSPGGEAVGAFEAAAAMRALSAKKPTVAIVNGMMASAAYAIGSAAREIVTTPTGVSGSIGVVMMHADYSAYLAKEGIKPTFIFAGAHKVDGNSFEPLPKSVAADLQAEVDAFYEQFLQTVAEGRGARTTVERARATEARTFIGEAAVKAGLADRVGTFESVLSELSTRARSIAAPGRSTSRQGASMSENKGEPAADAAGIPKADHEAAVAAARKAGAADATARIKAILSCEAAKGREAQAQAIAFDTDMGAEAAATVLAAGGKSAPAADRENPANALGDAPPPRASDAKAGFKAAAARVNAARGL